MVSLSEIEEEILGRLQNGAGQALSRLVLELPDYSWNQVFLAVDKLSREGRIALYRRGGEYILSGAVPVNREQSA